MKCKNLFFGVLALMTVPQLYAQEGAVARKKSESSFFAGMQYRNVGPNRGGRSLAAAGTAARKNEYYFGAVGGGLWKTTDGGNSWNPVTDGQINSSSVGSVAVSPSNPDVVYIGTGESEFRGNIMQGDGIYKSTDAGKTWKHAGLKNSQTVSRIRIHPTNPDIVYAAVLGHAFGPNEERGVFKSTDGGKNWKKVLYRSEKAGAEDLIIDPNNPNILYASIWEVYRTPWMMWGGGGASGLFKSTDGGETWEELTRKPGMPTGLVGKIGVTVSPVDSKRVWAIIESDSGGVYRSDDAGQTWKYLNKDRKLRQRAFYYSRIYADPKDLNGVYVLNVGFFKSLDGGVKFDKSFRVPHGDNHDLWIDPNDPLRMIEANDGGATVTVNGGATWTDEDFPTAQLYHIMATSDFPYHVAGAQQDNSTIAVPSKGWGHMVSRTNSVKKGMGYAYEVGGGESGYIAQDPKNPDVFYAGSYSNLLTRINRVTGERREVQPYPRYFMGEPAKTLPERVHWTYPIVFNHKDPSRMYVTSQHVWYTNNEGQSWEKISPDLTLADTSTMGISGGVITLDMSGPELYSTVYALAPSYHDVNTIWAGSDDGLIHITRDHGKSWKNITPPDMPKHTRVSIIEASPHKPGTAYIAAKRYQMNDREPYIWKTDDYGATWKKIVKGIRPGNYVHAVREDVVRPGLLFAGTEYGVVVSFDSGDNWQSLQLNLPVTQVSDMVVKDNDLAIATHGRSMYILDNINPIREYKPELVGKALHLFQPVDTYRRLGNAVFQYYLGGEPDSITVEISDASGNLIKSFTGKKPDSTAKKAGAAPAAEEEFYFGAGQKNPTVKKGLNVFEWDMKYPGAVVFDGIILWGARPQSGPMAPDGKYQIKITAGGETATHSFDIKLNPNFKNVTSADIREQFELASKINKQVSRANEAVIKIRDYKKKIAAQKKIGADLKKIVDELSVIEETIYQVKNQSNQDPLNFPIRLNNKLASLQRTVESGEARPTDDSYKVFNELKAELGVQIAALDKVIAHKALSKIK
ncbi:MAG TPA: hypothetical protein VJ552_07805 [Sediminibacterium sp.]|nr:hypothetical protein [Sediminibacterium sp.]